MPNRKRIPADYVAPPEESADLEVLTARQVELEAEVHRFQEERYRIRQDTPRGDDVLAALAATDEPFQAALDALTAVQRAIGNLTRTANGPSQVISVDTLTEGESLPGKKG